MNIFEHPIKRPLLQTGLHIPIFSIKEHIYTWKEVLALASYLGELKHHWDVLNDGIAACAYAESVDFTIPSADLQNAANALRYHFNLITAEETENWLSAYEITLEDLNNFLMRKLLRKHFEDQLATIRDQYTPRFEETIRALWEEIILSGHYSEIVTKFARRIVVREYKSHLIMDLDQEIEKEKNKYCQRENIKSGQLNKHISKNPFLEESFENLLSLNARFSKFAQQLMTSEKCEFHLKTLKSQLTKIEFGAVRFHTLEQAKEAYLCITEDGESLSEIARKAQAKQIRSLLFLKDIQEGLRHSFLSASVNETVAPRKDESDGEYYIYQVIKKIEPTSSDPEVYRYLQYECIKEALDPLVQQKVQWLKWHADMCHG